MEWHFVKNTIKMTVQELINALEKLPKEKTVVLIEPNGIGWISWHNIDQVIEEGDVVKITMDMKIYI